MLRVGLTGSIGVGKTFVAGVLANLGCHVLDADAIAREVVEANSPALQDVVATFGKEILQSDGSLDRAKLGAVVFANPEKRKSLESILHPHIIAEQDRRLAQLETQDPHGIAIVDAALMIESGGYKRFDKLIVVHSREDLQIQRIMARNQLSRAEAEQRIKAQMPQEEKKRFADYLIDTSDGFETAQRQTEEVYNQLRLFS